MVSLGSDMLPGQQVFFLRSGKNRAGSKDLGKKSQDLSEFLHFVFNTCM